MTTRGSENRDFAAYNFGGVKPSATLSLSVGGGLIFRRLVAAGGAAEVPILAAGLLPFQFRVLNLWAILSASPGPSTLAVWTRTGGAGTRLGIIDCGATGFRVSTATQTATTEATPAPATPEGIFFLRSDNAIAGEVFMLIQKTY